MKHSKDTKNILSIGISLFEYGVNNWALTKEQALQTLDEFEAIGIPILGGDVYEIINNKPQSNYDNWYYERNDNEELATFVEKSIICARQYIGSYRNFNDKRVFFVLVLLNNSISFTS